MSEAIFNRLLPALRRGERRRAAFFVTLLGLVSLAQTLGLAGSEALFLARVGIEFLPGALVFAAGVTVLGSLAYAAVVGRARNDRLFIVLLLAVALALAALTALSLQGLDAAPWLLFAVYWIGQAIFLNHFWTFAADYFDTLSSKRLFPLFVVGSSIGGLLGGVLTIAFARAAPPESLIAAWSAFLVLGALLIFLARWRLRTWGSSTLEESDESSVEGLRGAVRFLRRSPLGRWLAISSFGMVISLFVVQYLYSGIFAEAFSDASELAFFFGVYLTLSNLVEVVFATLVTPWLIHRVGVASANLVHPLLTIATCVAVAWDPRLWVGILARANRELLDNAMSIPLRNLVYNALPLGIRGRIRAFLEGIVVYSGMVVAGVGLLLLSGIVSHLGLCIAGGAAALLYLLANLRVRREYLKSLVGGMREGRLDLSEFAAELGHWEVSQMSALWRSMLGESSQRTRGSVVQLATAMANAGVAAPLVKGLQHADENVRKACVDALAIVDTGAVEAALVQALEDERGLVRRSAVAALAARSEKRARVAAAIRLRLFDPDPATRAEAAAVLGPEGFEVFKEMVWSEDRIAARAAFTRMPRALLWLALQRVDDGDARVRAEALRCVTRLSSPVPLDPGRLAEDLKNPSTDVRAAAADALATLEDDSASLALAGCLADISPEVRRHAVAALGQCGDRAVAAISRHMHNESVATCEAALDALALIRTSASRKAVLGFLSQQARHAWVHVFAIQVLSKQNNIKRRFLRAAIQDALARNWKLAFHALSVLEGASVVRSLERALRFSSSRSRGDALEVLSHLGDRDAARLLVLMAEYGTIEDKIPTARNHVPYPRSEDQVLEEARQSEYRWIRTSAVAIDSGSHESHEEKLMERLLILRQVPLFAGLSLEQLEAIGGIMTETLRVRGDVVVQEGDVGTKLYVLVRGEVEILRNLGTPQEVHLGNQQAISYFGEMAILDNEPRSASVRVKRDVRLLVLDGDRLKELIHQMPEIAFEILRVLARRVREGHERLEQHVKASAAAGGKSA